MTTWLVRAMGILYGLFLVWAVLWKCGGLAIGSEERIINLIPFRANNGYELCLNVLLFMPLGFYLSALVGNLGVVKRIAIAAAISLGFEILQFIMALGRSDITDVILNVLGAVIGVGVFALSAKIFGKHQAKITMVISIIITTIVLYISLSLIIFGYIPVGHLIFKP